MASTTGGYCREGTVRHIHKLRHIGVSSNPVVRLGCKLVKEDVASFHLLRSVHRRIGTLEQKCWGGAILRVQGDANTGSHRELRRA